MNRLFLVTLLVIQATFVLAQKPPAKAPQFDIDDFNKKAEIAEWLVRYDTVAWKTTDVMLTLNKNELARLGQEWFCFQDEKKNWHAIYGKFENNRYDQVFHFIVNEAGNINRATDKIDDSSATLHARALITARTKLSQTIPENSPTHNSYIRRNADKTFSVWYLPAFQPNGVAVYGGEFIYTIDPTGEKILKDESFFQGQFRGFNAKPPREIYLAYPEKEKPTLGSIFFVLYYKEYFTSIFIDNSKSMSTLIKSDSGYVWTHVDKDSNNAKPPTP